VIPTLRRSRDDVFLVGEEDLLPDQDAGTEDPVPTVAIENESDGRSTRRLPRPRSTGSLQGARGLAFLGLTAAALAFAVTLRLVGGSGSSKPAEASSPRLPQISRSAAGAPAERAARPHRRAARPVEVHRHTVHHQPPHQAEPARQRPDLTREEPEREPTPQVAPVSSPAVTGAVSTPAPEEVGLAASSTPPGPPPSSSGGGPAGVESFGFER
jgi:hypothetical protein